MGRGQGVGRSYAPAKAVRGLGHNGANRQIGNEVCEAILAISSSGSIFLRSLL